MGDVENNVSVFGGPTGPISGAFSCNRSTLKTELHTRIYTPKETSQILRNYQKEMYLFEACSGDFVLHVSTHAEPSSGHFNCGGLRLVPEAMVTPEYRNDLAALRLGKEMDAKGDYARMAQVAGPLVAANFERIHFGKHVACPPLGARAGEPREIEFLQFVISGLEEFRNQMGIEVITGQDLGHGPLATVKQSTLGYLSERFSGCMDIDTSLPTAVGNFYVTKGLLQALDMDLRQSRVGLVGYGNIGSKLASLFNKAGVRRLSICESNPNRQDAAMSECDGGVWPGDMVEEFLEQEHDVVIFNSNGGSLDQRALSIISNSKTIKGVTGCENMIWPGGVNRERELLAAKVIMPPTEFSGMGGWLGAAEASIAKSKKVDFYLAEMFQPLQRLCEVTTEVVRGMAEGDYRSTFAESLHRIHR
jgi:hypothetical protein